MSLFPTPAHDWVLALLHSSDAQDEANLELLAAQGLVTVDQLKDILHWLQDNGYLTTTPTVFTQKILDLL